MSMRLLKEEGYMEELGVLRINDPTQYSNMFEKVEAHLVEGSNHNDLDRTAP